jgi:hypothetical protein
MLPGIKNDILDGAMGVLGADATGRFAAIGVAANFGPDILTLVDPEDVEAKIGDGPLRDLLVTVLSTVKTTIYAVALEGTVPGTLSAVAAGPDNTGAGTVTVSGSPRNEYDIRVDIISSGVLNEGTFRVTVDNLPGKTITLPDGDGRYAVPGTGLTLTFSAKDGEFKEGDAFMLKATAPQATNGEVLDAVTAILERKLAIEWIAVTGISASPLWAALATKAVGAEGLYQYLFFVAQARGKAADETADQWVNALTGAERGTVGSTRLQVCAGWIEEADVNGQVDERGLIGAYCGMLAARKVHQGPDAVKFGGITAATAILPEGINDGHIETLKNAGYVTARQYVGRNGIYITSGQMMSEPGSDYDLVERRRVMDKACRLIYAAQLPYVNDAVKVGKDGSPEGLKMFIAQSENPLNIMKADGEISDGYVIIPEGQNILSTSKLKVKVRIVPLGKLAYIENEIAYSNPALGGE